MLRRELSLCRPERGLELIDPAGVDGQVGVIVARDSGLELLDPGEQSLLGRDGLVGNLLDELKRRSHLLQLSPRQRELSRELGGVGLLALSLLHGRGSRDGDSQLLALLFERFDPAREGELARFGRGDGGGGGGFRVAELDVQSLEIGLDLVHLGTRLALGSRSPLRDVSLGARPGLLDLYRERFDLSRQLGLGLRRGSLLGGVLVANLFHLRREIRLFVERRG
mmetsp:Transcript_12511/g.48776  ORF Transcript_12511/g.48776 Transcript_12511/m.48776 type:complete len:224 (+) Transcript_12511:7331-8002(+)